MFIRKYQSSDCKELVNDKIIAGFGDIDRTGYLAFLSCRHPFYHD